jgi:hypothetical protein
MHIVGERRIALQLRRSAGHVRLPRYVGAQEERHYIFSVASRALRARRVAAAWPPEGTHGKFDSDFVLLSESVTGGRYSPLASLSSYVTPVVEMRPSVSGCISLSSQLSTVRYRLESA